MRGGYASEQLSLAGKVKTLLGINHAKPREINPVGRFAKRNR